MSKEKFDYFIKGEKGKYEVVIGLEVHAQVQSKSKLFSGSSTKFGADPNNQVSLIDSAFPGMLPVINEECVKQAVMAKLARRTVCGAGSSGSLDQTHWLINSST